MTDSDPELRDGSYRLVLRAHGATAAASALVFGDRSPLVVPVRPPPTGSWQVRHGPEPACRQTAEAWGTAAEPADALAGPDLGRWTGHGLEEVALSDGAGLGAWLSDVEARPHGGESLADLVRRVGPELESLGAGRSLWVVTPLVARALAVAALAAPADLVLSLDVSFAGEVRLSRHGGRWRLQGLRRGAHPER